MHFWLHHTAHCASSASAERVGQGEVGRVTHRVTCTWWLLGLAVKVPWLGLGGPILAPAAWTGLENAIHTGGTEWGVRKTWNAKNLEVAIWKLCAHFEDWHTCEH